MINTASTFFPFPTDVTRPAGRRTRPSGGVYKKCPTSEPDSLTPSLPTGHTAERGREQGLQAKRPLKVGNISNLRISVALITPFHPVKFGRERPTRKERRGGAKKASLSRGRNA